MSAGVSAPAETVSKPKKQGGTAPRPNREGIYPAETWRQSNPDYEKEPPKVSENGRSVSIDAGGWYDYEQSIKRGK